MIIRRLKKKTGVLSFCKQKKVYIVFLVVLLSLTAFFYRLTELGVEYDEALFTNAALNCPHQSMFLHKSLQVSDICLPVMVMPYLGATQAYILKIVYEVFGVDIFILRATNAFFFFLSIFLLYLAMRNLLSKKIALFTSLLLLLDTHVLLAFRYDRSLTSSFFLKTLFFYAVSIACIRKDKKSIFISGLFLGILLFTKIDILFLLLPMVLSFVVFFYSKKEQLVTLLDVKNRLRENISSEVSFISGMTIGLLPYLYYLRHSYRDVLDVSEAMSSVENKIVQKILYIVTQNSSTQLFELVYRDSYLPQFFLWLLSSVFFIFLLSSIFHAFTNGNNKHRYISLVIVLFYSIVLLHPALGSWGKPHHLLLIYPFPHILITIFLLKQKKIFIKVFLFFYFLTFIFTLLSFYSLSSETCGRKNWSCSIADFTHYIESDSQILVAGDWGLATQMMFYSKGKNPVNELFFLAYNNQGKELQHAIDDLTNRCSLFLLPAESESHFTEARDRIQIKLEEIGSYSKSIIFSKQGQEELYVYTCNMI